MPIIKNKFFIIIILLILMAGVSFWFFYQKAENSQIKTAEEAGKKSPETETAQKEETTTDPLRQKNIIYEQAVEKGDISKCNELGDSNDKNLCLKFVALKILQINICESITDDKIKNDCINELNFSLCKNNKDKSSYDKINDINLKQSCLDYIITDYSTPEDCEKLSGEFKDACLNNYYLNQATEKKDFLFCQKLPNENWEECFQEVLDENADINECEKMPDEARKICFNIVGYKLAIEKIDAKYCQNIYDETKKSECIKEVEDNADNDKDGLNNATEKIYGTNPDKKDTDGDGHTDSDEIKNGFNPNGEGKLNANNK